MIEPRFYRQDMGGRFNSLVYRFKQSDLWVAYDLDTSVTSKEMLKLVDEKCRSLWTDFESYFEKDPQFKDSFKAYPVPDDAPMLIKRLSELSFISGVGPMAGIAGLFAEEIGKTCKCAFGLNEIIVENGGDLYIDVRSRIKVSLFAGRHPLSNKIKLDIGPANCPLGLCASSGKFGHSVSLGQADLVSVACEDPVLADQFATAFANKIISKSDIATVLAEISNFPQIIHISIYKDDQFGIAGALKVLSS